MLPIFVTLVIYEFFVFKADYKNLGYKVESVDHPTAIVIRRHAQEGDAWAQYLLASIYDKGSIVTENDEMAVYWYGKSAEQGLSQAQYLLAYMYDEGLGIEESDEQAIYWYRKSAEQGLAKAQRELAIMYYRKKEVAEDYVEAHKWFNIAFKNGYDIGEDRSRVIELEEKMTSVQIKLAQSLAKKWTKQN